MAWITPVTDRTSGTDMMTYEDMNRISGNVSHLYNYAVGHGYTVSGGDVDKTSWTQNDIIEKQNWESLLSVLSAVRNAAGLMDASGGLTYWSDVNTFESYTLETYTHIIGPSEYGLLQDMDGEQLQTENEVDLEAGII